MTDEQRSAAHKVDGILLEPGSDLAGLLELQRRGIPRLGVSGDWRVSRDRSDELPTALKFGAKSLTGGSAVLCRPHFARGSMGRDDGEGVGEFRERQAEFEACVKIGRGHWGSVR